MLPTFANWVEYFDSLPLSEKVNKSHLKALLREFNGTPDATTCETKLEREHESVYMAKLGIGGSMKLFHHFKSNKTFCTNKDLAFHFPLRFRFFFPSSLIQFFNRHLLHICDSTHRNLSHSLGSEFLWYQT